MGVVFIRLENIEFIELLVRVLLLLMIWLFLFNKFVWLVMVWMVLVVLNIVVIINVSIFGSMVGWSVFIILRLKIRDLLFLLVRFGIVIRLWYFIVGLKIKLMIEIVIIINKILLGMWYFFRLKMIVSFSKFIIIGKEVNVLSVIGKFLIGFLIIIFILLVVISSRNRLILIFVLWVIFIGKLCKIQVCILVMEMVVKMMFIRNIVFSVIGMLICCLSIRLNVVNVVKEIV